MSTETESVDSARLAGGEERDWEVCVLSKTIQGSVRPKDGSPSAGEGDDYGTIRVDGSGHNGTLSVQA